MSRAADALSAGKGGIPELVARIDAWLAAGAAVTTAGEAPCDGSDVDLETALHTPSWSNLGRDAEAPFDRLRKKVEVARRLCRCYAPDLSRCTEPAPLSEAAVARLCGLLLKAALVWRDLRYLNSALKLLDGVLEREDCAFPDELRALAGETLDCLVPLAPRAA